MSHSGCNSVQQAIGSPLMNKMFLGGRLRRLREQRQLSQVAAARAIGLSSSYYNQLENNERPLTKPVLVKMADAFGVDVQTFCEEQDARLIADMREALGESIPEASIAPADLHELAASMPQVGQALVKMHQRLRDAQERADALAHSVGGADRQDTPQLRLMPFEEVRDFFYARHNHIEELDTAAEKLFDAARWSVGDETQWRVQDVATGIADRLTRVHRVDIVFQHPDPQGRSVQRAYDPRSRRLVLDGALAPGRRAFQLATQLAFLEFDATLENLVASAQFSCAQTRALARIGLANYFAGALLLPYARFLASAESLHYDIDLLAQRFGVGFEVTCHRLSTLQRTDARGVPFFFIRVDRAGNISKRQSATDFHFSRVGGTCPLWNVYEAFAQPGKILRQLAQMPDGRTYLWIARTVSRRHGGYGAPSKTFAIALGCDVSHAHRTVYSQGLALNDPDAPTPIGTGCKVCERTACPQRAFPPMGSRVVPNENARHLAPYVDTELSLV